MKRRSFIVSSGGAVLLSLGGVRRPSMAVSLTLKNIESKSPSSIDSMQAEFSTFNFTPKYVDSSEPVSISAKLEVTDGSQSWSGNDSAEISNYNNGSKNDVSDRLSPVIEGISATDSVIDGELVVDLTHPNLETQTYRQTFSISKPSFLSDPYIRVTKSLESYEQDALNNSGSIGPEVLETHVGPKGTIKTSSGGSVTGIERKDNGERKGTSTVRY